MEWNGRPVLPDGSSTMSRRSHYTEGAGRASSLSHRHLTLLTKSSVVSTSCHGPGLVPLPIREPDRSRSPLHRVEPSEVSPSVPLVSRRNRIQDAKTNPTPDSNIHTPRLTSPRITSITPRIGSPTARNVALPSEVGLTLLLSQSIFVRFRFLFIPPDRTYGDSQ